MLIDYIATFRDLTTPPPPPPPIFFLEKTKTEVQF